MSSVVQKWHSSLRINARIILILLASILTLTGFVYGQVNAEPEDTSPTFTLAQVPDTQQEVMNDTNQMMPGRFQWLADNKQALNLKFIAHVGDVVNWGVADPVQFTRANRAVNILDNSGVPYALAAGNHDTAAVQVGGSAAPGNVHDNLRNTSLFNQTFPVSRFKNVGGTFEANKVDNMWQTFTGGSKNWLVLTHEMWPRQSVIDWMKGVVSSHPNYNVVINTHAFINNSAGNLPTSGNYGDKDALYEWNTFVSQYPNIKMVLSGHYGPASGNSGNAYHQFTGVNGNKVAAIMTSYHSDYQNHVRLLNINAAENTISSSVYVSVSNNPAYPTGYIHDASSDFVLTGMNWINTDGSSGGNPTPPVNTAPDAPTAVTAAPGVGSATVSFTPPANNGGSAVTSYTVTSSPGNITATGTGSPITVGGLTNGVSYTFTVKATNAFGTSNVSVTSNGVTPFVSSPELLSDPGFESGTGGWTPFLVGTLNSVTSPVQSGSRALSIAATSSAKNWVGMTNNSVITNSVAGRQYTVQCYVRPLSSAVNVEVRMLEYTQNYSSNSVLGTNKFPSLPVGTWSLVQFTGTALRNNERVIPQIYSTSQTTLTGNVMYDDCSVTAGVPAPVVSSPGAPTAVSAVADDGQATVSFTPPTNNGGAQITGYTVTSAPGNISATGSASPVTVGGLTNGVSYTFTVRATNSAGTSTASSASNAVVPVPHADAPGAPTDLVAAAGNSSVALSWNAPVSDGGEQITDYLVYYRATGSTTWLSYAHAPSVDTVMTVSGLTNNTDYEFIVMAVNAIGTGSQSNAVIARPLGAPATISDAPSNVAATAANASAVVSFDAPVSDGGAAITSYTVTSSPGNISATGSGSPITVTGLTNGESYTFSVRATNSVGTSDPSSESGSVTPATVPTAPTNLATVASNGQVALDWTTPTSDGGKAVSDYVVQYKTAASSTWLIYTDGISTTTSAIVTGLTNGTAYNFRVAAVNEMGSSSYSASSSNITPFTTPGTPTNVNATAGNAQVVVSFTAPASNGGSVITGYTVTSIPGGITVNGTSSPITVTGLTNGVNYTFTVSATNAAGVSTPSNSSASVTPTSAPPLVEYLSDPGFETGTSGWTAFLVGTLSRVTGPVRTGFGSMQIAATSSTTNWVGMTNNGSVTNSVAGKTYTAECYVRPTSASRNVQMRFLQYTQNYSSNLKLGTTNITNLPINTWTLVKVTGVATASGQRIIPQIYSTNQTTLTGTINYDDCSISSN